MPGVGSVCAVVHGPAAMVVGWTLAFSGGFPVLFFEVEYRRVGTSHWRAAVTLHPLDMATAEVRRSTSGRGLKRESGESVMIETLGGEEPSYAVPGHWRRVIVGGLESEEGYVFRVRGGNELGVGEYVESEAMLSHTLGEPRILK